MSIRSNKTIKIIIIAWYAAYCNHASYNWNIYLFYKFPKFIYYT